MNLLYKTQSLAMFFSFMSEISCIYNEQIKYLNSQFNEKQITKNNELHIEKLNNLIVQDGIISETTIKLFITISYLFQIDDDCYDFSTIIIGPKTIEECCKKFSTDYQEIYNLKKNICECDINKLQLALLDMFEQTNSASIFEESTMSKFGSFHTISQFDKFKSKDSIEKN